MDCQSNQYQTTMVDFVHDNTRAFTRGDESNDIIRWSMEGYGINILWAASLIIPGLVFVITNGILLACSKDSYIEQ